GSAFGWSVYFPDDKVVAKSGDLKVYAKDGAMSYDRFFCARCGTTLYWKSFGFLPDATGIAGGCFVDDPVPEPSLSAQDRDHCSWLTLPDNWLKA
ncbi:MAG TPA: GFA family protein, partial [Rhizomicrobium sp.]|nr:GFA family protein [Rhizomicrobium sp.]